MVVVVGIRKEPEPQLALPNRIPEVPQLPGVKAIASQFEEKSPDERIDPTQLSKPPIKETAHAVALASDSGGRRLSKSGSLGPLLVSSSPRFVREAAIQPISNGQMEKDNRGLGPGAVEAMRCAAARGLPVKVAASRVFAAAAGVKKIDICPGAMEASSYASAMEHPVKVTVANHEATIAELKKTHLPELKHTGRRWEPAVRLVHSATGEEEDAMEHPVKVTVANHVRRATGDAARAHPEEHIPESLTAAGEPPNSPLSILEGRDSSVGRDEPRVPADSLQSHSGGLPGPHPGNNARRKSSAELVSPARELRSTGYSDPVIIELTSLPLEQFGSDQDDDALFGNGPCELVSPARELMSTGHSGPNIIELIWLSLEQFGSDQDDDALFDSTNDNRDCHGPYPGNGTGLFVEHDAIVIEEDDVRVALERAEATRARWMQSQKNAREETVRRLSRRKGEVYII